VLRISISLWSQKKKSPIIPAALRTIIHKTSFHVKALSGLMWNFMQIPNCECSHIHYDERRLHHWTMNVGFILTGWSHKGTSSQNEVCLHAQCHSFCTNVVLRGWKYTSFVAVHDIEAPPPSPLPAHAREHTSLYASHQKFSWRCFQCITLSTFLSAHLDIYLLFKFVNCVAIWNWQSQEVLSGFMMPVPTQMYSVQKSA
jgi:hypothetical protein